MAKIFSTNIKKIIVQSGGGGNIPPGAAVMTDSFGPLRITFQDTNALQTDAVAFTLRFPESNAAQTDAVAFKLQFPDNNAIQTDSFSLRLTHQDTNAALTDTANFLLTATYQDSNAAQTDLLQRLTIRGFSDTNDSLSDSANLTYLYRNSGAGSFTAPKAGNYTFTAWGGGQGGAAGTAVAGGTGGTSGDRVVTTLTLAQGQVIPFNIAATSATAGIGNNTTVTLPGGATIDDVSLVDSSGNGRTLTKVGTVNPVASPTSGFNGAAKFTTGSSTLSLAVASAGIFDPRAGRVRTYEVRFKTPPVINSSIAIAGQWSGSLAPGAADWLMAMSNTGGFVFSFTNSGGTSNNVAIGTLVANTEYVLAVELDTNIRGYIGGVLSATVGNNIHPNASATDFRMNLAGNYTNQSWGADEVRFSDVIRYGASYTPATTPFTADANTLALYHLDTIQTPVASAVIAKGGSNATASTGGTITAGQAGAAGALLAAGGKGGDAPGGGIGGAGQTGAGSPGKAPGGGGGGGGGNLLSPGAGSTGASGGLNITGAI